MGLLERLRSLEVTTTMTNLDDLLVLSTELIRVILSKTLGEVVELGVYTGTTSRFLHEVLKDLDPTRQLHLYDSFQGLPDPTEQDQVNPDHKTVDFQKGSCHALREQFDKAIAHLTEPTPVVHEGWFADQEYPDRIAFAFLDGDFYTSIRDSLEKVYPRLSPGGTIAIHDYGWYNTPGVKRATDEFMMGKPEVVTPSKGYTYIRKEKLTEDNQG